MQIKSAVLRLYEFHRCIVKKKNSLRRRVDYFFLQQTVIEQKDYELLKIGVVTSVFRSSLSESLGHCF